MGVNYKEVWRSFVIPVILFPALFLLTIAKMIDTDLWFHMKAGQVISETGSFIYKDIFSFTAAGRDWFYHEWLFGVISYYVYSIFGVNGLILGKATLLTLTFLIIYKCMRLRGANHYLSSFILFIAVLAARFRFTERPHVFKFLFVAAFIYFLDLYRLKEKNHLWLLPVLQLLWTNIHGSFILGPAIIAIYLFLEVVSWKRRELKALATILVLTSAVTLINPYGFKLLFFSLGFGEKAVLTSISEWEPTRLKDFYGAFGLLFVAGVSSFAAKYKKIDLADLLLFGLFAYLSIKAIRFTALFSLATAPVLAGNIQCTVSAFKCFNTWATRRIASTAFVMIAIIGSLFVHEIKRNPLLVFGLGQGAAFPQKAVEFIKQHEIHGNMYNSYAFGGYLVWSFHPERKVFVDGRAEVYDKEFQESFISGVSINKWIEAVNRYDINYAVIAYSAGGLDLIGKWISKDTNWVLIYWDDAARVYVRDTPVNQDIIKRFGHRVIVNPATFNFDLLKNAINSGLSEAFEMELKRDINLTPENTKVLYWLGMLYYETGRKEGAVKVWEKSIRIRPDANTFSSIGNVFAEKRLYTEAIDYYKKAIEADKRFAEAYYNLGNAYEAIGDRKEATESYKKFIKYAGPEYADIVKEVRKRVRED